MDRLTPTIEEIQKHREVSGISLIQAKRELEKENMKTLLKSGHYTHEEIRDILLWLIDRH